MKSRLIICISSQEFTVKLFIAKSLIQYPIHYYRMEYVYIHFFIIKNLIDIENAFFSCGHNIGFRIQRSTVRTLPSE